MNYSFDIRHAPSLGGEPILDREAFRALEELAGDDDPELITELVGLFMEDSSERMQQIESAIATADAASIGAAAHALKSSSANIGARSFSQQCAKLEEVSRSSDESIVSELEGLVRTALAMYAEVCGVFQDQPA